MDVTHVASRLGVVRKKLAVMWAASGNDYPPRTLTNKPLLGAMAASSLLTNPSAGLSEVRAVLHSLTIRRIASSSAQQWSGAGGWMHAGRGLT